jgi:protein TonB
LPSAPPAPIEPVRTQPRVLRNPSPSYPPIAKQARISGVVHLSVLVARDGSVKDVRLVSGQPMLAKAAMDAVKTWRYAPTVIDGQPVEALTDVSVKFNLSD